MNPSAREVPRCYLDDDGEHFWFDHDCRDVAKEWADGGHPLEPETAQHFQAGANHHTLPLGGNGWTLVQREPLTVSPSILCGNCGTHGFFREGKWVPA